MRSAARPGWRGAKAITATPTAARWGLGLARPEDPATTGALTPGTPAPAGGPGYEMNFENAPVATVAKAILGDILGVGYTIDPRVQATVSLSYGPSRSEEGHPLRV